MNVAPILSQLIAHQDLSHNQMHDLMQAIMTGELSPTLIAACLIGLRCKGESTTELAAATEVIRSLSTKVSLAHLPNLVDTCGTGGDGARTFNISTAAAFVTAAAGANVAKHGGRSVSSVSGSADVLEALGVNVNLSAEQVARCVQEIGIGFMFAPNHHSAMKHAAPVRRELGVRTLFNLLGPMTNPADAPNQVMGVFDRELTGKLAHVLQALGSQHVMVVHAADGMDELSLSGISYIAELHNGSVHEYEITPEQFGLSHADSSSLTVHDTETARSMLIAALSAEHRAASDIVALNAGAAIYVAGMATSLNDGINLAQQQITTGAALRKLEQLKNLSQHV
jgi:anthranilate phosphoribosyltransferase